MLISKKKYIYICTYFNIIYILIKNNNYKENISLSKINDLKNEIFKYKGK